MFGENDFFPIIWAIICIIVVLAMSYWVTKYVAGRDVFRGTAAQRNNRKIQVLAQEGIGREQRIALISVGDRYFLLGITTNNISMLAEMTKEEAALWKADPEQAQKENPSFMEAFKDVLKQKTRR